MNRSCALLASAAAVAMLALGSNVRPAVDRPFARPGSLDVLYAAPGDLAYAYGPQLDDLARVRASAQVTAGATFDVTYAGFDAQAEAAFQAAADIWSRIISSPAPIRIHATLTPLGAGVLGQAGPTVLCAVTGGRAQTYYPAALADKLAGSRFCAALASDEYDIVAEFSRDVAWDFGTSGVGVAGRYNFMTVALHEIAHGLGILGAFRSAGGTGSNPYAPFAFIYDRFATSGSGVSLLDIAQPSAELHAQLTSDNTYFKGTQAVVRNLGLPPKLETHHFTHAYLMPSDHGWLQGSSYSHVDDVAYTGTPNGLMTWALNANEVFTDPGPVLRGLFEDMGWIRPGPPDRPVLVSPSGRVVTDTPTFIWQVAAGATSYDLYVGPAMGGTALVNARYEAAAICAGTSCSVVSPVALTPGDYLWWVRGRNVDGDGPWSAPLAFRPGPLGPVLTHPVGTAVPNWPQYVWTAHQGATRYQLWVQDANGVIVMLVMVPPTFCSASVCAIRQEPGLRPFTGHTAWIRAEDGSGFGPWSPALTFTTGGPPATTQLLTPRGTVSTPGPAFEWHSVPKATSYTLWVERAGGTVAFVGDVAQGCGGPTCRVTLPVELQNGAHIWWLQPRFSFGAGNWSPPVSFSVDATVPGPSAAVSPEGLHGTSIPTFRWTPSAVATWYYLWVAPLGGTPVIQSWFVANDVCSVGRTTCSVAPRLTFARDTQYFWWVRTWNSRGDGPWSAAAPFTIASTPPGAATLTAPADPVTVDFTQLVWNRVPEATYYLVWLRRVGNTAPLMSLWMQADEVCGATECQTRSYFLLRGDYEFYLQTYNDVGYGPWSAARLFTR